MQSNFPWKIIVPLLVWTSACQDNAPPPTSSELPPAIRVTSDRNDLIFSFTTNSGKQFQTAQSIKEIPEAAKRAVVVTDLSLSPAARQANKYVYIADLRKERTDGTYSVALASRYGFEANQASTSSTSAGPSNEKQVIVYSASWCGVCKRAMQLLKSWKVPFEEKDVEASRAAQKELADKAARAGLRPGGVPVIDVAGVLLLGLDEATLRSTLKEKQLL